MGVVQATLDILFFVSFFPQFIAVTHDFTVSIITLSVVWVIFDFSILSLYITDSETLDTGASRQKRWFYLVSVPARRVNIWCCI